jgi:hypothetical protein
MPVQSMAESWNLSQAAEFLRIHPDTVAARARDGTMEECPACGSTDLHSALLNGEDAISCCDCVWIATIASFQADGEAK